MYTYSFVVKSFIIILLTTFTVSSSETDQYLTWDADVKDSADSFNRLINTKLAKVIKSVNKKTKKYSLKSCRKLTLEFMNSLGNSPSLKRITKFDYQKKHPERYPVDIYPRKDISIGDYYLGSIHNRQKVTKIKELGRSFNVGGVHIGNDKMTHFVVIGLSYYKKYLKKRSTGANHERALKYVMWRGFQKEASILGLKWGTFSFADLESNYQGFRLAYNLCEAQVNHVKFKNKRFEVVKPIDIREYFTPGFDESYNRNYFRPYKLKKVVAAIDNQGYCGMANTRAMKKRFSGYKSRFVDMTSQNYAKKLLNISIKAEASYPKLSVEKSYFPMTIRSQTLKRICNNQIAYNDTLSLPINSRYDSQIESCATKQAGFKIRGRILSKTRRDINAAITNFVTYAEDYCYKKGKSDFKIASEFSWVPNSEVSSLVPFDPYYVKKCLVGKILCI